MKGNGQILAYLYKGVKHEINSTVKRAEFKKKPSDNSPRTDNNVVNHVT